MTVKDVELKVRLTPREREVLELMGKGMRNKEIAEVLKITKRTVAHFRANLLAKLGATNGMEAVANAFRLKILS